MRGMTRQTGGGLSHSDHSICDRADSLREVALGAGPKKGLDNSMSSLTNPASSQSDWRPG
jgi:hypothetical protein